MWGHAAQEAGVKENIIDEFGELHASGIHIVGRIVLNLWRQMQASALAKLCRLYSPHGASTDGNRRSLPDHRLC